MNITVAQNEFEKILEKIDARGRFAMDLEFIPERNYTPVLCLVQIAIDEETFLVDPLQVHDLSGLWERVADPAIQKVFHAAVQDLSLIYKRSSLVPQNIFDTQIAAGFAGFGYPAGYGKLLQQLLGITIDKSESFTDWLARPLSPEQIQYAEEDVCHMFAMADKLTALLEKQGRLAWAEEECKHYSDSERYEPTKKQEFTKIKGSNNLNRRSLGVLQSLCEWRDQEAAKADRPLRSILSDNTLLELSRRPPKSTSDIERIRGIRIDQVRSFGKKIIDVITEALKLPEEACPSWSNIKITSKRDLLIGDMLYAILKVLTYEGNIATELLATRDDVQYLVRLARENKLEDSNFALLQGWRYEMAGKILGNLLQRKVVQLQVDLNSDLPVKLDFGK